MILPLLLSILSLVTDDAARAQPPQAPLLVDRFPRVPVTPQPNVLVIVLDDWGWPERSITPSLDQLSSVGVTLDRFYAEPVCSIARYAALTGRYPRRAGIGDVVNSFNSATGSSPAPNRTDVFMPEVLKPTHSTCLVGKWHLGRASVGNRIDLLALNESGPFANGFDFWLEGNPNAIAQGPGATGYYDWYRVNNHAAIQNYSTYATAAQRDGFTDWWTSTAGPKFCWLAWVAPHQPFDAPPGMSPTGTTRGDYEQVVTYLDGAIDDVLSVVDLNDTYVVVWGDNGTPDDARPVGTPAGFWKLTTFEGGVRVPLIIAGPGITAGVTSHRLASAVDLGPTLFEMLGIESRGYDDGVSFADALGPWSGAPARTWLLCERYDVAPNGQPAEGYDDTAYIEAPTLFPGTQVTVRLKRRIVDIDGVGPGGFQDLLYDLVTDHNEVSPVAFSSSPAAIQARFDGYATSLPPRP